MKKFMIGLMGVTSMWLMVSAILTWKSRKQERELDETFAEAERMLRQQEVMLRKQIREQEIAADRTTMEINELVEEVNKLMADMGLDDKIVDVRRI